MTPEYQTQVANSADQRTLGFFQLSVATSLAIESAVGIHPDAPNRDSMPTLPVRNFKEVWINLRTLYRNIVGAMAKDIAESIDVMSLVQIMVEEMRIIPDMLHHYNGSPVKVVYYVNNLNRLENKYPEASLRTDNTPRQQQYTQMLKDVLTVMIREIPETFLVVDDALPGAGANALIITHIVYDLLSAKNFTNLMLLESHTGRIKSKALWYTKYYQGKTLSMIPFTEELLQVFGDHETFHPLDKNLRAAIIELANHRQWSSVTTRARILDGINELKNPAHVLKMKKIYKVFL
jgi:hypothetical protein